jgi:hypothetical protein
MNVFQDFFEIPGALKVRKSSASKTKSRAQAPADATFISGPWGAMMAAAVVALSVMLVAPSGSSWRTTTTHTETETVDLPFTTYWLSDDEGARLDELIESTRPTPELARILSGL